jgi:hypothetical protein
MKVLEGYANKYENMLSRVVLSRMTSLKEAECQVSGAAKSGNEARADTVGHRLQTLVWRRRGIESRGRKRWMSRLQHEICWLERHGTGATPFWAHSEPLSTQIGQTLDLQGAMIKQPQ